MIPPRTYATRLPSNESEGCAEPLAAPIGPGKLPSSLATLMPEAGSTYAIALWSDDHDGSEAEVRNVGFLPVPSGLIVQMFEPHVYAIRPLLPGKTPPCADDSDTSPAAATSTMRPFGRRRRTGTLYPL